MDLLRFQGTMIPRDDDHKRFGLSSLSMKKTHRLKKTNDAMMAPVAGPGRSDRPSGHRSRLWKSTALSGETRRKRIAATSRRGGETDHGARSVEKFLVSMGK